MENKGHHCCDSMESEEAIVRPCEPVDNFKPNCDPDLSKEIRVHCTDICNAKCVGILAEKIYDCVYADNLQFADKDEVFTIDNFDPNNGPVQYRVGDSICIDDISLCYDYIGTKDDANAEGTNIGQGNVLVRYDMDDVIFSAVPGTAHKACNCPDCVTNEGHEIPPTVSLYNEFEGAISNNKCNSEISRPTRKVRVFKQGVKFYADNLKVRIRGRIGSRPFTATKDYGCYGDACQEGATCSVNPVEITKKDTFGNECGNEYDCKCGEGVGLNFAPVNLYGRVSVPNNGEIVRSNIRYQSCLSADCIETNERYGDSGIGQITATVGYSFLVTNNIRHTVSEELAVFTNPNGVKCRNTERESACVENENNDCRPHKNKCENKCENKCGCKICSRDCRR